MMTYVFGTALVFLLVLNFLLIAAPATPLMVLGYYCVGWLACGLVAVLLFLIKIGIPPSFQYLLLAFLGGPVALGYVIMN